MKEIDRLNMMNTRKMTIFHMADKYAFYRNVNDFLGEEWHDEVEDEIMYKRVLHTEIVDNHLILFWEWI